jgi:hypothetical protein
VAGHRRGPAVAQIEAELPWNAMVVASCSAVALSPVAL